MNNYNRKNAVNYALSYALTPNTAYRYFPLVNDTSGDCSNFISQCLFAGGAPMLYSGNTIWWYKRGASRNYDTWTVSWTVAHGLYWFLKINGTANSYGAKGYETSEMFQLEIGDLIFFEDTNGLIFHSTIISSFQDNTPLVCQHSFEARNLPYNKSWDHYKLHFIKIVV